MLRAMHSEYTSITDELESVCGLLSPPRTPRLLSPPRPDSMTGGPRNRNHSELSNPEMAKQMEKETLRDAEENDYLLMEGLIQNRLRGAADGMFSTVIDDEEDEETVAPLPRRFLSNKLILYFDNLNEISEIQLPVELSKAVAAFPATS